MQITIDTSQTLSPEDREVLALIIGVDTKRTVVTEPAEKPAPAKRPAAKPAAKPEPTPEPESEEDEDLLGGDEDAVTKQQLVELVTATVAAGHGKEVKAILVKHGAAKVSLLDEDKYATVFAEVSAL